MCAQGHIRPRTRALSEMYEKGFIGKVIQCLSCSLSRGMIKTSVCQSACLLILLYLFYCMGPSTHTLILSICMFICSTRAKFLSTICFQEVETKYNELCQRLTETATDTEENKGTVNYWYCIPYDTVLFISKVSGCVPHGTFFPINCTTFDQGP
jgi:hypothetical protein